MADKINKPQGTFAKLMSSSPIKEEKEQNSGKPENLKMGNQENLESGKPENLKTGNHDFRKAVKYSTQLHEDTIMRLKQYALLNNEKDYTVVEDAIIEYLDKRQNLKT